MRFKCRFLKKKFLLLLITLGIGSALYANDELKSLADSLRRMIDEKPLFIQQKEQRINRIKCLLKGSGLTLEQKYKINFQLCNEYKKFVVDSAIHYVDQNLEIARKLNNRDLKNQSSLQLSLLYSMCGRYRDAELILEKIKTSELSKDLLSVYYETYSRFWEYYSITANSRYGKQRAVYQDSLLSLLDQTSFDYKLSRAYYYGGRDSIKAKTVLQELLDTEEVGTPHYAMITHAYASFCWHQKKMDERKKYLMMSAIDDVVSSGIHFRAMEIYKFYSIINTAYQTEEARSKSNLITFLISTSIILFLLVLLVICIYIQMRKILKIKRALVQSNEKLLRLNEKLNTMNNQLNEQNNQLSETNNIKEHYIAEFFDVCFSYISKMEKYQNVLYKYAINKYYDELIKKLKSSALIDEELNALYARFDRVFLNLYPTFVSDFNALLKEEERIVLKTDTLLNRELRIYALLRLGISDSGKIANFLRCSTSTVYNYRTKMRNKSAVDRDEFENEIMKICLIDER